MGSPPGVGERITWVRRTHSIGSPERGAVAPHCGVTEGLRPRRVRGGCLPRPYDMAGRCQRVSDVVRRPAQGASRTPPPTVGARHTLRRVWQRTRLSHASQKVRGLHPRDCIRWVVDARMAHRGKRGCNRSRSTSAANLPRRSRDRGAPRTVHPTGGSVSNVAAYNVTGAETIPKLPAHFMAPQKRTLSQTP